MITKQVAQHLAEVVHEIRGDWDRAGIVAAIAPVRHRRLAEVALAAVLAATTPTNRTPAVIAMAGEHWRISRPVGTGEAEHHPSGPARTTGINTSINALCRHCCRPRAGCQADTAQALDPHEFVVQLQPVDGEKWTAEIRDQLVRTPNSHNGASNDNGDNSDQNGIVEDGI